MYIKYKFITTDTLNDSHRASKLNNIKKQKKPKGNNGTTHEEQSIRIFRNMQEEVRNRLTCCAPGQELEVNKCLKLFFQIKAVNTF